MKIDFDGLFKIVATLILGGTIIFWVIPTIFSIIVGIFIELFVLIIYLFIGYVFIKAIENIWSVKGVKL
jgi:hypothetical protein